MNVGGPIFWTLILGLILSPLISFLAGWVIGKSKYLTRGNLIWLGGYYTALIGGYAPVFIFGESNYNSGPGGIVITALQNIGCLSMFGGPVIAGLFIRNAIVIAHQKTHGRCPHCEYDLTDNRSGTCPECGNRVEKSSH